MQINLIMGKTNYKKLEREAIHTKQLHRKEEELELHRTFVEVMNRATRQNKLKLFIEDFFIVKELRNARRY